jgi:Zn-dependent peptidase ImmA (M78 family)
MQSLQQPLFQERPKTEQIICKRETILNAPHTDWMEWQAGYVCGAILMPASFVTELVSRYRQERKLCTSVIEGTTEAKELLSEVQAAFEVSADAARVRLLKLGLLVSGQCPEALFS